MQTLKIEHIARIQNIGWIHHLFHFPHHLNFIFAAGIFQISFILSPIPCSADTDPCKACNDW